ncbi:MAG TPA: alpha/beta hydrolase [Mycobacteriales bacterium]|nr:alpha/beta hydrolase [Mycobacteriales bacterium]
MAAHTFTASDGQQLGFHLLGSADPVLCVPGGPGRAATYLGDLGGLDAHRQLVLADPRGSGASRPAEPQTLTLQRLVDDLEDLRIHLALAAPVLLGHSFGCRVVAAHAEAERPARALVLLTPPPMVEDELTAAGRRAVLDARRDEPALAEAVSAASDIPSARPQDRRMLEQMTVPLWYGTWNDAARRHAAQAADEVSARTALTLRESARVAALPRLERLAVPILLVAGQLDFLSPPIAMHALHERLPCSTYAQIEGAGHYPWLDEPALLVEVIVDFLDGLGVA